ncbi:MAG TPA: hypothetical protein VMD49_04935 [Steroidobacteraceae bacterium]|jgi:hypothetical protein|nr:hypothetical protein [Steroidobacteraceae bacterium]
MPTLGVFAAIFDDTGRLQIEPGELVGVYAKPAQDDLVLSFTARVIRSHPWQPNGEIAERAYFALSDLPLAATPVACARMRDALDGARGLFRSY